MAGEFMIHTVEVSHPISRELYKQCIVSKESHFTFRSNPIRQWIMKDDELSNDYGINRIFVLDPYRLNYKGIPADYRVSVVINLMKLLDSNTSLEVFDLTKLPLQAVKRFDFVMDSLGLLDNGEDENRINGVQSLTEWRLNRIDYCCNLQTQFADLYTSLLNKGKELYYYDRLGKSGSNFQHCKSSALNFYSKRMQLENLHRYYGFNEDYDWDPEDELIDLADGMLRIEVQYWRRKVNYTAYINGIQDYIDVDTFACKSMQDMAMESALKYLKQIGFTGRYYTKKVALAKIKEIKNVHAAVKEDLLWIAKTWGQPHMDYGKVKDLFVQRIQSDPDRNVKDPERCFSTRIKTFNDHDINPIYVTEHYYKQITDKIQRKELRKNGIPSVYTLLKEELAKQEE